MLKHIFLPVSLDVLWVKLEHLIIGDHILNVHKSFIVLFIPKQSVTHLGFIKSMRVPFGFVH